MALINPIKREPIFATMVGASNSSGASTLCNINFASSIIIYNGVEKINNSTLKVSKSGLYELICPISVTLSSLSGSFTSNIQTGVNGFYSTYSTNLTFQESNSGVYSIIIELNDNDEFSLRSQVVGSFSVHTTRCNIFDNTTNKNGSFTFPTITFKRI
jgi:hypothetical protein